MTDRKGASAPGFQANLEEYNSARRRSFDAIMAYENARRENDVQACLNSAAAAMTYLVETLYLLEAVRESGDG